ncbi:hypothetical protein MITS9509_01678 [Synechococcus sp. MIT S9509]|nr:hypothetical protein MITS9504_00422 [Synechococcus sp. MIT S9504]KZR92218.1 hypothetical protein MITS9509_01678 [Synechococcus sp. MIT S9509]
MSNCSLVSGFKSKKVLHQYFEDVLRSELLLPDKRLPALQDQLIP